jgi:hypothetical protein
MADKPDFSFSHSLGRAGALVVECFNARTADETYVVTFGAQRVALSPVDFDNYLADLARMRDQVRAGEQGGA